MSQLKRNRGTIIVFIIAVVVIACAIFAVNSLIVNAGNNEKEVVVKAEMISVTAEAASGNNNDGSDNEVIIYYAGNTLPDNFISAQYAISITEEIVERIYSKSFDGKIFAELSKPKSLYEFEDPDGLWWSILAEVNGGQVRCSIDATTGQDMSFGFDESHGDDYAIMWGWFDEWDEETRDEERIKGEEERVKVEAEIEVQMVENLKDHPEYKAKYDSMASYNDPVKNREQQREWFVEGIDKMSEYFTQEEIEFVENYVNENIAKNEANIVNSSFIAAPNTQEEFDSANAYGHIWSIKFELDNGEYVTVQYYLSGNVIMGYHRGL